MSWNERGMSDDTSNNIARQTENATVEAKNIVEHAKNIEWEGRNIVARTETVALDTKSMK
jgi:hypothetical protein